MQGVWLLAVNSRKTVSAKPCQNSRKTLIYQTVFASYKVCVASKMQSHFLPICFQKQIHLQFQCPTKFAGVEAMGFFESNEIVVFSQNRLSGWWSFKSVPVAVASGRPPC